MTTTSFAVTWDYRCPFARNAHEHVITALESGAGWDVEFLPFSLNQSHVEEGGRDVWDDPARRQDLLAAQVGIAVRDKWPQAFLRAHRALFELRHDEGADLREESALRGALERSALDADAVFAEVASGWPLDVFRKAHEAAVSGHDVFGVPTFILGDRAAFVRFMTRPGNDGGLAVATIEHVLGLISDHIELNEFKHTSIPN